MPIRALVIILLSLLFALSPLLTLSVYNDYAHPVPSTQALSTHQQTSSQPYIIFLNGIDSYALDNFSHMGFEAIRQALKQAGYSYQDPRFLLFSYTGGSVVDHNWVPLTYCREDTRQSLDISRIQLEAMLEQLAHAHPQARFVLIGHSLGGRIAFDFLASASPRLKEKIKAIVTLNSPLLGAGIAIPAPLYDRLAANLPGLESPAIKQLVAEGRKQASLALSRREEMRRIQEQDIEIATFSSFQDLFVGPITGCLMDEKGQPLTKGRILKVFPVIPQDIINHFQILAQPQVLDTILSLCRA